jgi:hypothetical protein
MSSSGRGPICLRQSTTQQKERRVSSAIRYTMIPEMRLQAMQKVLRTIATIDRDWRRERIAAGAAMAAIANTLADARAEIPELQETNESNK